MTLRENILWWGIAFFWTATVVNLWRLAIIAARKDEKARKEREDLIEDQRILLMVANYIKSKEELFDCANEPDLEFQLRRSVEIQQEKNNRPLAS